MSAAANEISTRPTDHGFLILDYGSQYTMLISRRLRELGFYNEIVDATLPNPPPGYHIDGLVLSGGPDSAGESGARRLPDWVLNLEKPVLGICYGMQILMETLGGKTRSGHAREYGKAETTLQTQLPSHAKSLFSSLEVDPIVWMSHGDDCEKLATDFIVAATTTSDVMAAVTHRSKPIFGLQFHPEVDHTKAGAGIFKAFAKICQVEPNWQAEDMVAGAAQYIRSRVGDGHVLMAVSGGVDSSVAALLTANALRPDQVTAVFVDHGLLRHDEATWVMKELQQAGLKNLHLLDRRSRFLEQLKGVTDPEQKRKIIGRCFIEEFESFAKSEATQNKFTHLGQGTLYPDVIESAGHGAGSKVIKSHHNVGGLPEKLALKLLEPFRYFFKDEVRKVGRQLGLPPKLIDRHPFPGPGLAVRILGDITAEKIELLQKADHIFIEELHKANLYQEAWQAFAVLLPVKSVGVMGDNRTYQSTIALRAVSASDGMTAGVTPLPFEFLTHVSDKIVRQVHGINRVVYDITTKPPATIEWE